MDETTSYGYFHRKTSQDTKEKASNTCSIVKKIHEEMKALTATNITHVHTFKCKTTYKWKYCNAVPSKAGNRNNQTGGYEIMQGDLIDLKWLHETVVTHNNNLDWYLKVTESEEDNQTFELPIAAVYTGNCVPQKEKGYPDLQFPQNDEGVCGVSAFSSAFYCTFDEKLATVLNEERKNYLECLSIPVLKTS